MGAADIVPGVSGGTVALVFGIYERLVHSIGMGARALGSVIRGRLRRAVTNLGEVDWWFLVPLGAGILTAVGLLSSVIESQLRERPEEMAGLFFGLVLGSIVVGWRLVRHRRPADLAIMAAVGVVAFVLLGLQSGPVADPPLLAYLGAGAITICAMILPGISGSFLLLMMGMYAAVLGAVHDTDLVPLGVFAVGAVIGLALFSTVLNWLLEHHHDLLLSSLLGLMVGSLRVLWPWPHGVGILSEDQSESISGTGLDWPASAADGVVPVLAAVVAFALVVGVARLAARSDDLHQQ
jgi:putative membrane protein